MEGAPQALNVMAAKDDVFEPKKARNWTKVKRFIGLGAILFLLLASLGATYAMWFTEFYQEKLLRTVTLEEGGILFKLWEKPPVPSLVSIYIFNYTNSQKALRGEEKPRVQQLGPYVFRESMQRMYIVVNENGTLTYQERRVLEHQAEDSKGDLNDTVVVPNIPLMSALASQEAPSMMGWLKHMTVKVLKAGFKAQPFLTIRAHDFVWDYGDAFTTASTTLANLARRPVPKTFGILADREGLSPVVRTIWSGVESLDKVNVIDKINGMNRIGLWEDDKCDSVESTDGTFYPPKKLTTESKLYIYIHDFCRRVPFVYENSSTTEKGYPTHRFAYSPMAFASADLNPDNACFCNGSHCPPSGVFSISKCSFGAPIFTSYPHFLYGDTSLLNDVEGLNPDPTKHAGYMDIHATLGLPINGHSRFQIGIQVHHTGANPTYKGIPNGTILPLFWLDFKIGKMTDSVDSILYHYTFTSFYFRVGLTWLSPVVSLISAIAFIFVLRKR